MPYHHFTTEERYVIGHMRLAGFSLREIERRAIFRGTGDRERFVDRSGELSETTQTTIYAWT